MGNLYSPLSICCSLTSGFLLLFQARNIETGALAAVKIIKLEPGEIDLLLTLHLNSVVWVFVLAKDTHVIDAYLQRIVFRVEEKEWC